jgi:Holliday junction resolvase RusA-like endonuclease
LPHQRDGPDVAGNDAEPVLGDAIEAPLLPLPELSRKAEPRDPSPDAITVIIDGLAVAKGRPRFARSGVAYTPAHSRKYEAAARFAASAAMDGRAPLSGAVRLDLVVELPIPASWSKKRTQAALRGDVRPTSRPDLDNYVKSALDAINTIVIGDDCQIVELTARKQFSEHPAVSPLPGESPRR